jgi:hypothetical protein
MTSIRHSDTPALERRRELVANELRLIDAELERRGREATQAQCREREAWIRANPEMVALMQEAQNAIRKVLGLPPSV